MGKADSPLNMRLKMSFQQWRWLLQFLRACNSQTNKMNGDHIFAPVVAQPSGHAVVAG